MTRFLLFAAATMLGPAAAAAQPAPIGTYYIDMLAERRVDILPAGPLFWRVETLPTASEAAAAMARTGAYALTAAAGGRNWLFTLGKAGGATAGATPVAEIGPIPVPTARHYLLRINHAGGPPGSQTPVHSHPGSEAIYVLRGQVSQRTPHGIDRADAGSTMKAHGSGMAMQLVSSGDTDLEQLVMFVVDADRPFSQPAVLPE